ncbi:hypothetical protein V3C99_009600, partial [Haemonchus contortus]
ESNHPRRYTLPGLFSCRIFACLTDGKFEYDLFGDIEKPHRDLLTRFLNKTFDDGDLVLEYKVDSSGYDGGVYMKFPSVILRNVC